MGWKLLDRPKTLRATAKLAKQFMDMDPAPQDRPLSERRLMVYQRILREGGFRPVSWASALCTETGGLYRVNGKHTSTMLVSADPFPDNFYVVVEEYECETLADVAKLYSTYDSNMQSRSASDIYMSFAGTVPELRGVVRKHICLAVAGMSMHLSEGGQSSRTDTPAERAELLMEHTAFALWMHGILAGEGNHNGAGRCAENTLHLRRAAVIAGMMATWLKNPTESTKFWNGVRDETGESPDKPDRKLAKYLLTTGLVAGGTHNRKAHMATSREMYVKCLHAWNAWRKGEPTALQYHADKPIPSVSK